MRSSTSIFAFAAALIFKPTGALPAGRDNTLTERDTASSEGFDYHKAVLDHHNAHRANHSVDALSWGPFMAENARVLAERCVYQHDVSIGTGSYGQNIAAGTDLSPENVGKVITGGFYDGEVGNFAGQYGQPTPDMSGFEGFGHFTQLVWKDSLTVGCNTYDCSAAGGLKDSSGNVMAGLTYFTVCNYWPVGNMMGDFEKNVFPPKGLPNYPETP